MTDTKYIRHDFHSVISHLVEECGEVLAASGKLLRWGPNSSNPELPLDKRETNRDWLLRELDDLEDLIARSRAALKAYPHD